MDPRRMLMAVVVLATLLAGCGGAEDGTAADGEDEAAADGDAEDADDGGDDGDASAGEQGAATVATAEVEGFGELLVDGEGMTLYLFDPDEQGPSTCYDDCAANWPPLVVEGEPVAGDGVDADLLGTAERDDGSVQVTYDGWPLYHWAADQEPGDASGQGVEDVWWVVEPDGSAIRESADDAGDGSSY